MINKYKNLYIAAIIFIQTAISIFIGLLVFFIITQKSLAPGVYVSNIYIGNMSKFEAGKILSDSYNEILKKGYFQINYEDNKNFKINYKDINASINVEDTLRKAQGKNINSLTYKLKGYFLNKKLTIYPVLDFDIEKLKAKLAELGKLVDKKPVTANINLIDDKIVKTPEIIGLQLDQELAYNKVSNELPLTIDGVINFYKGTGKEIEPEAPEFLLSDFNGADEIISQYSTNIGSPDTDSSIRTAVKAINKVALFPKDLRNRKAAGTFSFDKYLGMDGAILNQNNEGYNQVASTLNAAVLKSDINKNSIVRTIHKSTVDYIDPGLDAVVLGNNIDYKFTNTTDNIVIIFAQIREGRIVISLVGKSSRKNAKSSLKIEVLQRYDPGIFNTENQNLKTGEQKLISPGKEGVKINVYRITDISGKETTELLYNNLVYDSVKALVESGPVG